MKRPHNFKCALYNRQNPDGLSFSGGCLARSKPYPDITMKSQGFSLIELMIVIVIIGVLASISFAAYLDWIGKSQVGAALAEIRPGITNYEILLLSGEPDATYTPAKVGLSSATNQCEQIIVQPPQADGTASPAIRCILKGGNKIAGKVIQYDRTAAETNPWVCKSNVPQRFYLPFGCVPLE